MASKIALALAATRRRSGRCAGCRGALDDARGPALGSCGRVCPPAHVPVDEHALHGDLVAGAVHDGLIEGARNRQQPRLGLDGLRARRRRASVAAAWTSTRC